MPEVGQTMLYCDEVGFQRLPDIEARDGISGAIIAGQRDKQYAFILKDTAANRIWVVPVSESVRKIMVDAMRKAPLDIVGEMGRPQPIHGGPVAT
jgi:hypothetical protein